METLQTLRERLPEAARDIKLNLQTVLAGGSLTPAQRWGVAVASALASRHPGLSRALVAEARANAGDLVVDDWIEVGLMVAYTQASLTPVNVFDRLDEFWVEEVYTGKDQQPE